MQIVSNGDTLHEMSNPFLCVCVCVCVCVCAWGGAIFDLLTFTTLLANSAERQQLIGLPELSFTKYTTFLIKQYVLFS